ncbi:2'-5' RNA ligase family protein [Clostridium sardiniense]|uniref:2'-5' RNA ligase family protein n=1 Tax=Clostridium sardiniense TaxID=29369 RepID=UPI003D32C005
MRYVIVCVVNGDVGEFNNNLRKEVFEKFNVKSSKLPAHFTIKAPFEYDNNIEELENLIEDFCSRYDSKQYIIDGYDHFDDRVIYMKVNMSNEGKMMHDDLIDRMEKIDYIEFDKNDGRDKTFHITIASKKLRPIYDDVWNYVKRYPCEFECLFDNISIYRWQNNTWELYRKFNI